jgi:triacylglycerol lipase
MPATLSPFRYIQMARYVLQWWVDAAPMFAARRKAAQERAAQFVYAPRLRARALAAPPIANAIVADIDQDRASHQPHTHTPTPGAHTLPSRSMHTDAAPAQIEVLPPSAVPRNPGVDVSGLNPLPDRRPDPHFPPEQRDIYRLMNDPRAFLPGAMQAPREVVVLCHGELSWVRSGHRVLVCSCSKRGSEPRGKAGGVDLISPKKQTS